MKLSAAILLVLFVLLGTSSAQAVTIQEVTSKKGIHAWLVEDHKLPLVAMHFAFRGGVEQDPPDKQGLTNLTINLLTQGAGSYDAEAFQHELADHSIGMQFEAGRDALFGNLKMLKADQDKAFDLLRLALTEPHFDHEDIERLRARQLAALRVQLGDPGWQGRYALLHQIFGMHPYGERRLGTTQTLKRLSREDIVRFAALHLAQDNLLIAVAGDMRPDELAQLLDQAFGNLPKKAKLSPVAEVTGWKETSSVVVPREGTQTELFFALPSPKRTDSDWYAADIANYILGGGGFSSRLTHELRDTHGLTYGISTGLSPMQHAAMLVGEASIDNPKVDKAWVIIRDALHNFHEDGVTEKEITGAKDYLTGALPLTMTSTDKIASVLVSIQLERLGIDYMNTYNDLIRSVTAEDVERAIKRWFNPDQLTLVMVGKPEGIEPMQTQGQVRE